MSLQTRVGEGAGVEMLVFRLFLDGQTDGRIKPSIEWRESASEKRVYGRLHLIDEDVSRELVSMRPVTERQRGGDKRMKK